MLHKYDFQTIKVDARYFFEHRKYKFLPKDKTHRLQNKYTDVEWTQTYTVCGRLIELETSN